MNGEGQSYHTNERTARRIGAECMCISISTRRKCQECVSCNFEHHFEKRPFNVAWHACQPDPFEQKKVFRFVFSFIFLFLLFDVHEIYRYRAPTTLPFHVLHLCAGSGLASAYIIYVPAFSASTDCRCRCRSHARAHSFTYTTYDRGRAHCNEWCHFRCLISFS